jgi:hypothetical protein
LSSLRLSPTREAEIVDELSQHLEDRYRELISGGASPEDATRLTLADFRAGDALAQHLAPLRQAHAPAPLAPAGANRIRTSRSLAGRSLCRAHLLETAGIRRDRGADARARESAPRPRSSASSTVSC